jgi:hypothetical protein
VWWVGEHRKKPAGSGVCGLLWENRSLLRIVSARSLISVPRGRVGTLSSDVFRLVVVLAVGHASMSSVV